MTSDGATLDRKMLYTNSHSLAKAQRTTSQEFGRDPETGLYIPLASSSDNESRNDFVFQAIYPFILSSSQINYFSTKRELQNCYRSSIKNRHNTGFIFKRTHARTQTNKQTNKHTHTQTNKRGKKARRWNVFTVLKLSKSRLISKSTLFEQSGCCNINKKRCIVIGQRENIDVNKKKKKTWQKSSIVTLFHRLVIKRLCS